MRHRYDRSEDENKEAKILSRINELECALNDQLNDCINFDGGKLTDVIMEQSSKILKNK